MSLAHLPASSRIWFFLADRNLNDHELQQLNSMLSAFVSDWTAHGKNLSAGYEIKYNCLVVIAVDESAEAPSGCSIDKVFRLLTSFGGQIAADFFKRTLILVPDGESTKIYNKTQALELHCQGILNDETPVLNTLNANLGDYLNTPFISLSNSWLGKAIVANKPTT
jgi:hypothetical protein